ncbi:MAG: DUF4837 family protein [Bacteroidales bacterium]|nr:DUF4837 family protein [Bacteroidales bacterium]
MGIQNRGYFKRNFEEPYEVLPQYEPLFDIMHVPHSGFSSVIKAQRNILMVNIAPRYEPKILAQKDMWASPQLVISINAPNDTSMLNLIQANKTKLVSLLEDMERKRMMDIFDSNIDLEIYQKIQEKFNIGLKVPKGYNIHIDSTDFIWLSNEYSSVVLGLMVYEYNYTDSATFTKDYLIEKRNYITKKFIEGEIKGSYMVVEEEYGPFFSDYLLRGERYVAELRGLWRMEKGIAMGGPFVNLTTLDEENNKIISVDGFVFAAGREKRNFMRQIEAIVLSLQIPG